MDITEVTDRDAAYEADTATARRQTFAWSPFLAMDGFLHGAQGSAQGPARCTLHAARCKPFSGAKQRPCHHCICMGTGVWWAEQRRTGRVLECLGVFESLAG